MTYLLIFCIGNRDGGDDAIGPYIADQLNEQKNHDFTVIDCGTNPENYTSIAKQKKPDILLFIDAVEMGLQPGEIRIVPKNKIGTMHVSTHGIPLSLLITYLEKHVHQIFFIGIQPKTMQGTISKEIRKASNILIKYILEQKLQNIPNLI